MDPARKLLLNLPTPNLVSEKNGAQKRLRDWPEATQLLHGRELGWDSDPSHAKLTLHPFHQAAFPVSLPTPSIRRCSGSRLVNVYIWVFFLIHSVQAPAALLHTHPELELQADSEHHRPLCVLHSQEQRPPEFPGLQPQFPSVSQVQTPE